MLDEDLKQEYTKDLVKETLNFRKEKLNEIFPDGFDNEKLTDALYNSIHKDDDMKYANDFFTNLEDYVLNMDNASLETEDIPYEERIGMSDGDIDEYYAQQEAFREEQYEYAQRLKQDMNKQLEELSIVKTDGLSVNQLEDKKVLIYDPRINSYSSETTIEGMFDALEGDYLYHSSFSDEVISTKKDELNVYTADEKRHFIEFYGYEINDKPTFDLIGEYEFDTGRDFYDGLERITPEKAQEMFKSGDHLLGSENELGFEPRGLFYYKEDDTFIGIDNSDSEAFVEEFKNLEACVDWLYGDQEADYYKEKHIKRTKSNESER